MLAWDVRGGAGVLGAHRHPHLASVNLRGALARVPGLTAETAVPPATVASLALDARDHSRVAFSLSCGWSGARPGTACAAKQPETSTGWRMQPQFSRTPLARFLACQLRAAEKRS